MLGVTFSEAAASHKKDKDRKHKKHKKKDKDRKKSKSKERQHGTGKAGDSATSSSDDDDGVREAAAAAAPAAAAEEGATDAPRVQREEWMTQPMARLHAVDEKQEEEASKVEQAEPEVVIGLRVMKPGGGNPAIASAATRGAAGDAAARAAAGCAPAADSDGAGGAVPTTSSLSGGGTSGGTGAVSGKAAGAVGDGGLSWRLKALKRAQQQAAASGQDVSLLVSQRWGSLQSLTSSLTEGHAADSRAHVHSARDRERAASATPSTNSGRHYITDLKSDRGSGQMKRPVMDDSLRWKRTSSGRDSGRESSVDRDQQERSAASGGSAGVVGGGERGEDRLSPIAEGQSERKSDVEPVPRSSRDARPPIDRSREGLGRSRLSRGEAGSEQERDEWRHDDGGRRHDRHHHRHHDDRGRHGDDDRGRGSGLRGSSKGGVNTEVQAALKSVAGELNRHANDGSFMERFQQTQQQHKADEGAAGRARGGGGGVGRQRDAAKERDRQAADDMKEEMKRLRQGLQGEGGEGSGSEGDDGGAGARAGLEMAVGSSSDSESMGRRLDGGGGGGSSSEEAGGGGSSGEVSDDTDQQQQQRRKGGRQRRAGGQQRDAARRHHEQRDEEEDAGPPTTHTANKSAAEMLRARLKGQPTPSVPAAAHQPPPRPPTKHMQQQHHDDDDDMTPARGGGSAEHSPERRGKRHREVVALPLVESSGRAAKGAFGREGAGSGVEGGRPPKRVQRYDQHGEKVRYFADDDADLDTLVKRTKHGDDANEQVDLTAAHNIMRRSRFKEKEMDVDDEYDYDGGMELYESRGKKGTSEQQASRERSRQVAAYNRAQKAERQCLYCINSTQRPAWLTLSVATLTYLTLPAKGRLAAGHCCIMPKDHLPSMRLVDDNVWTEVKNFIKCLIQMAAADGKSMLFWETATALTGNKRHAVLEAIPVTAKELDKAPAYFKKAMQEAESEWSTHAAKSVIEINAKKGLRESIPPNFPYVYVQFGYGHGFVHVIDDERKFDVQMARQTIAGLLRLPDEVAHQRGKAESASAQQQWAREFITAWAPFDWTLQLQD